MKTFAVIISLEKLYGRRPSAGALLPQVREIAKEGIAGSPKWKAQSQKPKLSQRSHEGSKNWVGESKVRIEKIRASGETPDSLRRQATRIIGTMIIAAKQKNRNWDVKFAEGPNGITFDLEECRRFKDDLGTVETAEMSLPPKWKPHFSDMFGLDPQIRLIMDPLLRFVESDYRRRGHILLWGRPGCGKTTIAEIIYAMVASSSPKGAVLRFTASQTTKAGLENTLIEANPRPTLIVIEEMDKSPPDNLSCLLDMCNTQGEIRKTTATQGHRQIPMSALILGTVNSVRRFKTFHAGALASRFAHKVFFPRPGGKVLRLIGERTIREYGGTKAYGSANKAIDTAIQIMQEEGTNDPRRMIALLDAGKRLTVRGNSAAKDLARMRTQLKTEAEEERRLSANRIDLPDEYDLEVD